MTHLHAGDITLYFLLFVLTLLCLVGVVTAGEVFTKDGAAIRGYDPVAYLLEKKPVKGSAAYTNEYRGSVFQFASATNRDTFAANLIDMPRSTAGSVPMGWPRGTRPRRTRRLLPLSTGSSI